MRLGVMAIPARPRPIPQPEDTAKPAGRRTVAGFALETFPMVSMNGEILSDKHLAELRASAISDDIITERGYETITNPKALPDAFIGEQRTRHGYLLPIRDVTGDIVTYQLKPDVPRIDAKGKPIKYETAKAGRSCIDVPTRVLPHLRDKERDLWITEGCKKVDSGLSHGLSCIIGLLGVDGWSSDGMALPDWKGIALRGRHVVIAFDSDVMTKGSVRAALERFARWLELQQADVRYLVMPDLLNDGKGA